MSLSYEKLTPVCVNDPRIVLNKYHTFPVLKTGSQVTYQSFTATSVSQSSVQITCNPPSGGIIVDRLVWLYVPVRLTFTAIPPQTQYVLMPSNDAPRAFPIAGSIDTLSATINNQQVTINSADIIHAMMRYNTDTDIKSKAYSMTPTYQDQSQSYNDCILGTRNPLGLYQDSLDGTQMGRGGFSFTIVQNPVQTISGTTLTAIVDAVFCEPLFLSPFLSSKKEDAGFINVSTMSFNITFLNNFVNRMWSHNNGPNGNGVDFTSATAVLASLPGGPTTSFPGGNQIQMLFQYITPQENMIIPRNMPQTLPYFQTQRYITDLPASSNGNSIPYTSNNIQLNSVPLRIYLYVRERNADLYSSSSKTDTYFRIDSVNLQFLNNTGLLASANFNSLYDVARRNGCQLSYTQFSGGPVNNANFTGTFGTVGSVLALDFGKDIGLPALMAPGILGQCQLAVNLNASNISGRTITPSLFIVVVYAGTYTVTSVGNSTLQDGVITPTDILDCQSLGSVSFNDVYDHALSGGDWFTQLTDFGSKLLPYLQKAHDFIKDNKLISKTLSAIPYTQQFGRIAQDIGYGEGVSAGGARLHRKDLHSRLSRY